MPVVVLAVVALELGPGQDVYGLTYGRTYGRADKAVSQSTHFPFYK